MVMVASLTSPAPLTIFLNLRKITEGPTGLVLRPHSICEGWARGLLPVQTVLHSNSHVSGGVASFLSPFRMPHLLGSFHHTDTDVRTDGWARPSQLVVEKMLVAEGTSGAALGRADFTERVWAWKREYGGAITGQLRRLGASCDWSREQFTLDPRLSGEVLPPACERNSQLA